MVSISFLLLLFAMATFSLLIWASLHLIDYFNVVSKQKLLLHKIGIILLICTPLFSFLLNQFQVETIKINVPTNIASSFPIHSSGHPHKEAIFDWVLVAVLVYLFGLFIMISRILFSYLTARKLLKNSVLSSIEEHSVFLSNNIKSPLSFGIINPKIYFPLNSEKNFTAREQQLCLSHELNHIKNNDPLWKLFSLIMRAFLFFTPWSYSLHRKFENEMEIYCDELTRVETKATIQEYGSLLLRMICNQPKNIIFTNINGSILKRRLIAMKVISIKRPIMISIISSVLLLTSSVVIATSINTKEKSSPLLISTKFFLNGNLIASPQVITVLGKPASLIMSNDDNSESLKIHVVANNEEKPKDEKINPIRLIFNVRLKDHGRSLTNKLGFFLKPNQEEKVELGGSTGYSYEMRVSYKYKMD